ncbi:MAG: ABC-F family ATP-binding cassette domain-containing protein, partial [Spirochaetia bacterium]
MSFIQLSDVSLSFGAQQVLSGCSATMYKGERTALVGPNGCGKTTLLKILAGMAAPDSGTCYHPPGSTVYYLPQSGISHSGKSLYAEAETAFQPLHAQEAKMRELEVRMAKLTSSDSSTEKLVEQHHTIQEKLLEQGYYQRDEYIHRVLTGLGFSEKDFECRTDQFSGGWQMRIALAKALLTHPDILLLDEPTNYLDIEARTWLEDFFGSYSGGLMVVSHDRYFLDVTVNKVAELFQGMLRVYNGNYSAYKEVREKELEALYAAYEKQQAEIAKHEDFIRRFRYNASKASLVQSRVKLLEKLERIQIPENMKTMHFHFPPAPRSGKIPVALEGLSKSYGAKHVLSELNFELERGEKVVIAGVNGAGKTTLSRIVAGADCDYEGTVKYTSGVKIGYFAQNQEEHLDPEKTVLETAEEDCPTELFGQLKNLLGAFLFRGDDVEKKVGVLSGGEKSRLALLKLLLEPVNLLILDEPTNHLDMTS